jgi:hypothetical protein
VGEHAGGGGELGFKTVEPQQLLFTVTSADATTSPLVPDADVNLRLEHTFTNREGGKTTIFFHNSEERKPSLSGRAASSHHQSVLASSFMVVFSNVRSAQDIFKVRGQTTRN